MTTINAIQNKLVNNTNHCNFTVFYSNFQLFQTLSVKHKMVPVDSDTLDEWIKEHLVLLLQAPQPLHLTLRKRSLLSCCYASTQSFDSAFSARTYPLQFGYQ